MVPFSKTLRNIFDASKKDDASLTWHHLIRMTLESIGGQCTLTELYERLSTHPKAKKNSHYKERIRATIYEHRTQYTAYGDGLYGLNYQVA